MYSFKIFGLDKNLSIWEPNPFWLKRLFYLKKLKFNLFRKDFKNIKFYGDGFLCLSERSIPFWLDNGVFKSQNYSSSSIFTISINYKKIRILKINILKSNLPI